MDERTRGDRNESGAALAPNNNQPTPPTGDDEPSWVEIARREKRKSDQHFGEKFAAKIKAGRNILMGYRNYTGNQRKPNLRPIKALYFSNTGSNKAWQMKKVFFATIYERLPGKPPPIVFVRNIGNSILEVLISEELEAKAISILRQWGHIHRKKINPLVDLLKKQPGQNAIINAKKCKEKAMEISQKFAGPEVKNFYAVLAKKADVIINAENTPAPTVEQNGNEETRNAVTDTNSTNDSRLIIEKPPPNPEGEDNMDTSELEENAGNNNGTDAGNNNKRLSARNSASTQQELANPEPGDEAMPTAKPTAKNGQLRYNTTESQQQEESAK